MGEARKTFLGIPETDPQSAQVVVLSVPFEETASYGHGSKNGPKAIIKASAQVELFDPEIGDEIQNRVKIFTDPDGVTKRESMAAKASQYADKFLVSLGGEHSVTPELVRPFFTKYPDLSVLQIDAHTDLRDEWEGSPNSHACAMRRVQELGIRKIIQVGIRNTAKEEQQYVVKENVFWGDQFDIGEVISKLTANVYLTFDVDGLDISVMPATGTPEPGGLSYQQALDLMESVCKNKNVVAADFVELAPIQGMSGYDFLVAKLVYKLIQYKFVR